MRHAAAEIATGKLHNVHLILALTLNAILPKLSIQEGVAWAKLLMAEYKLSASLKGHEDDVKDVAFAGKNAVTSASRDGTVRYWLRDAKAASGFDDSIAVHGTAFVNACAFFPPSEDHPQGLILSGGKETIIDVRPPGRPPEADAERLLIGHAGNICSLDVSPVLGSRVVASGSWDASAIIWDVEKGSPISTLEGGQGSVWAVLILDGKTTITGCADKMIRIYNAGKLIKSFSGGQDVVRALCRLPQGGSASFASAGNDAVIRLWTLEGVEVAQLHGHENFIYKVATLPNGDLVSSSEDRTLRIWHGTECVQTITHPAISVWSVNVCAETGDIVTGASDKIVRIFSKDPARQADPDTIKAFEDSVRASAIPQQALPEINKDKLPGPEFLTQKSGTKEGQVQMIREANGSVSAHQWSTAAREWLNIGTVVESAGSSGRKIQHLGKDYDYVFDVDIKEGEPPLKLPFNLSENPHEVASKFIMDNELPTAYLDQVVNFIITNTQGASIGQSQNANSAPDPWGSSARYRPDEQRPTTPPRPSIILQKAYLSIATSNLTQMFKKVAEINDKLLADGQKGLSFSPQQMSLIPAITGDLEAAEKASAAKTGDSKSTPALEAAVEMAVQIITTWPPEHRIPGLDLYRCLCAATPAVATLHDYMRVIDLSESLSVLASPTAGSTAASTFLMLRAFANIFTHAAGRGLIASKWSNFWAIVAPYITPPSTPGRLQAEQRVAASGHNTNRNISIAAATWCINAAILLIMAISQTNDPTFAAERADGEIQSRARNVCEALIAFVADPKTTDSEVCYRCLVGIGTLVYESRLEALGKGMDRKGELKKALAKVEKGCKEARFRDVIQEIRALL